MARLRPRWEQRRPAPSLSRSLSLSRSRSAETVTSEIRSIEESEHEIAVAQPDFEWEDPQGFSAPV